MYSHPLHSEKIREEGVAVHRPLELKLINRDECVWGGGGGEVPVKLVEPQTAAKSNVL